MSKKRRTIEVLKDLVIVALVCSALFLLQKSRIFRVPGMLGGPLYTQNAAPAGADRMQGVRPLRMAVMSEGGCCGIQYGDKELAVVFSRMAPLLNEALSSAQILRIISQTEWEQALAAAPGVYFDFQGATPLSVLSGWLSGQENQTLTASARHLLLTADGAGGVALLYRDEGSGEYTACAAPLVTLSHLQSAAAQTGPNGAVFACQAANYRVLDPSTIIGAQTPRVREYAVSNPLPAQEGQRLNQLLETLSFPLGITTIYETPEGRRARSGNDTLSVTDDGLVTYYSTPEEQRYPVSAGGENSPLYAAVDSATRLVRGVLEPWQGDARLYLDRVEEQGKDTWRMEFRYALDDTPVQVGRRGYAATVLVQQGYITEFELQLRTYTQLEQTTLLLPQKQATAALIDLGKTGSRLQLRYQDNGELARAGWIAAD